MRDGNGDTTCEDCRGTGREPFGPLECVFCDGTGVDVTAPRYTRPNTGNHPDHPPVPGGYRGGDCAGCASCLDLHPDSERRGQVINPGLATEAVIDVTAEREGCE